MEHMESVENTENILQDLSNRRVIVEKELSETMIDPVKFVQLSCEMQTLNRRIGKLLTSLEEGADRSALRTIDFNKGGSGGTSITVFFKADANMAEVKRLTEKCVCKKWMNGVLYAYEQKGETEAAMGHNPHVHFFVPNYKTKCHAIRELARTLEPVIHSEASVHVLPKPPAWFGGCAGYLHGHKAASKMPAVAFDGIWRTKFGLPQPSQTAVIKI